MTLRLHVPASARRSMLAAAAVAAALAWPSRVDAHRLDEYLQAARLSLSADSVRVEMDLSPGVAVAAEVIDAMDANRDGRIVDAEAQAYAEAIVQRVSLAVDGRAVPLRLARESVPPVGDMREGIGTIQLVATGPIAPDAGRRRLTFSNANAPGISVYLVNAMTPADRRITIAAQHRDPLQRTFTLDYDVAGNRAWRGWSGAALAMVGVLVAGRRRSRRRV